MKQSLFFSLIISSKCLTIDQKKRREKPSLSIRCHIFGGVFYGKTKNDYRKNLGTKSCS